MEDFIDLLLPRWFLQFLHGVVVEKEEEKASLDVA
ncbi:hypothetical protein Vi05172_g7640 [Venturia inaequalis]|nr:hypothetical protein Vi05172_g7640 [Venturia inaequalis]